MPKAKYNSELIQKQAAKERAAKVYQESAHKIETKDKKIVQNIGNLADLQAAYDDLEVDKYKYLLNGLLQQFWKAGMINMQFIWDRRAELVDLLNIRIEAQTIRADRILKGDPIEQEGVQTVINEAIQKVGQKKREMVKDEYEKQLVG